MLEKKVKHILTNDKHLSQVRVDIGMVFQHFNLFPHMTILDNCMTAPIQVQKEDKTTAKKRSIDMLEKVGLGDKIDNYPDQLSGGQKQRVAMRSEEHTSELQSRGHLVCRLLLEKKKIKGNTDHIKP